MTHFVPLKFIHPCDTSCNRSLSIIDARDPASKKVKRCDTACNRTGERYNETQTNPKTSPPKRSKNLLTNKSHHITGKNNIKPQYTYEKSPSRPQNPHCRKLKRT